MHRPLRIPFHLRVWNLIKGLLFYNTVYWEKASDGLNMPTLTREEREQKRPVANFEIIKPRGKPRARLDEQVPATNSYETQVSEPPIDEVIKSVVAGAAPVPVPVAPKPEGTYVKRRKYKRRRSSSAATGNGFLRRVFGKE